MHDPRLLVDAVRHGPDDLRLDWVGWLMVVLFLVAYGLLLVGAVI